jgi:DNA polymerase-3 subunit gamma/tau
VLARKYRPRNFDDLIGQEAMVRTLSNAFSRAGALRRPYLLTGVRGVGKTTTARILARALNYEPESGRTRARPSTCRSSACIARRSSKAAMST